MNLDKMQQILNKIKEYDRIILFRHFRPDGDAVGSTKGLQRILQLSFPEKEILLDNRDTSEFLAFLGPEAWPESDEVFADALGIVLDTGTEKRISSPRYKLCKELCRIDHHIDREPYGDWCWVEEERSSTCEMVVHFYNTFRQELKMDTQAATALFTGMVTDSGRFRFRSVSGETMRLAGLLLDQGVNTDLLFAHLYLEEYDHLKFKSHVYENMDITPAGVAHIYLSLRDQEKFGLSPESASACVSFLESIKGALCWIAFIEMADGSIRVRLRSRFVTINTLAERYRGGGHACAAGATLYGREEYYALLREADQLLREYKENSQEEWL
jgi:phosphoesterase RecJ-like protein